MSPKRIALAGVALCTAGVCATAFAAPAKHAAAAPLSTGVVNINTTLGYQGGSAAGTGMLISSAGVVLTNNHVIRGATAIKVVIPSTHKSYSATVVGYTVANDIAVLKLKNASNLKTVSTGNSSTVKVGQKVTALGNAGATRCHLHPSSTHNSPRKPRDAYPPGEACATILRPPPTGDRSRGVPTPPGQARPSRRVASA